MEPGTVPTAGQLRISLTTLYGSDFRGGHFARQGITSSGALIDVPLYRHEVSLDYMRVELEMQYTLRPEWDVVLRVPWEKKVQSAGLKLVDAATDGQSQAMWRDINLHHRSETYSGLSDLMLLGRRRGGGFTLSLGLTAPTGRTEPNPYLLGARGIPHRHIQFGTGTVDPLVETSYVAPVTKSINVGGFAAGRFPLYENRKTYQAPPDVSAGVSTTLHLSESVWLRAEGAAFYQRFGRWAGIRDQNTGLLATSATVGAAVRWHGMTINGDVRLPISQRTLAEGDAFKQGPTLIVSVWR